MKAMRQHSGMGLVRWSGDLAVVLHIEHAISHEAASAQSNLMQMTSSDILENGIQGPETKIIRQDVSGETKIS